VLSFKDKESEEGPFAEIDANGDGLLTELELVAAFKASMGEEGAKELVDLIFLGACEPVQSSE